MSVDSSLLSFLSSHLFVQKKPITYRLLSREKNLHVSVARDALEKFHKENAGKEMKATYVVQGSDVKTGEGHILLVGEDRLEGECDWASLNMSKLAEHAISFPRDRRESNIGHINHLHSILLPVSLFTYVEIADNIGPSLLLDGPTHSLLGQELYDGMGAS